MYLANHADAVGDDWRRITLNDPDSDPADAVGRASSNTGRSFLNPRRPSLVGYSSNDRVRLDRVDFAARRSTHR